METLLSELRLAARRLGRRPGFAGVAVATLALGIGGATAIFSVADAVILRPLPFPNSERLVVAWQTDRHSHDLVVLSYKTYQYWRDQNHVFEAVAGLAETNSGWTLTRRGEPVELMGHLVTANFFAVIGVRPALGRAFEATDDRIGAAPVVMLSYALWHERFSEDPAIVGQSLVLGGEPRTVVGVMPKGFAYPHGAKFWLPLVPVAGPAAIENGGLGWMTALGRLRSGVSLEVARTEMTSLVGRYLSEIRERVPAHAKHFIDPERFAAVITPLSDALLGPTRPALLALLGAVTLVLLIACANVAGLLVIRATERRPEMAVRLALGASPGRLARGLFADSLLLAVLGGSAGLLAAKIGVPLLVSLSPEDVPRLQEATVDGRVFAFALAACLGAAVISGLGPMVLALNSSLETTFREGSRTVAAGRRRFRAALVVSEVAIALVLLVGAGLLGRSFMELRRVPLGFQPEHLLSVGAWATDARYPDRRSWPRFYQEVLRRVQALPGVESVAAASVRPLSGPGAGWDFGFTVEGQSEEDARANPMANLEAVSADYFRTMGIAVKRGRVFTEADADGQPGVVVVGESLARHYWPGEDPIGKRLKMPQTDSPYHDVWLTVVGVVGDARYRELQATRPDLYLSYLQADHRPACVLVRTRQEPTALAGAVREAVLSMDRDKDPATFTMTSVVSEALALPRFAARVFGAFALVALLLASLGLYGLLAYSVAWRTREIGVRVALGALPKDVGYLVLREGLGLTLTGIALGLVVARAATHFLESMLFGVKSVDGVTFAAVAGLLLGVSVLACGPPLRRALGVDPVVALRHE